MKIDQKGNKSSPT